MHPAAQPPQAPHLQHADEALHRGVDVALPRRRAQHRVALRRRVLRALGRLRLCKEKMQAGGRLSDRLWALWLAAQRRNYAWLASTAVSQCIVASHASQPHLASPPPTYPSNPPVPAARSCSSRLSAEVARAPLPTSAWKKACSASRAAPANKAVEAG